MEFSDILMGGMPLKKGKDDRRNNNSKPKKKKGKALSGAAKMRADYKARIAKRNAKQQERLNKPKD